MEELNTLQMAAIKRVNSGYPIVSNVSNLIRYLNAHREPRERWH